MSTEGRQDVANGSGSSTQETRLAIREGIRNLRERKPQGGVQTALDSSRTNLVSEAALSVELDGFRGQFDRFRALTQSLSDLDAELAEFVNRLGESPPSPPTLRGRVGKLIIEYFNRLLWWKTVENRRFAELTQRISRTHSDLLRTLQESVFNAPNSARDQFGRLLPLAANLDRRVQETEQALLDLQSWRTGVAAELHGARASRTAATGADTREGIDAAALAREHAQSQKTALSLDGIQRDLKEFRENLQQRIDAVDGATKRIEELQSHNQDSLNLAHRAQASLATRTDETLNRLNSSEERANQLFGEIGNLQIRVAAQLQGFEERVSAAGRRLADLGLQNQRIRSDVSLQERRLTMFLTEARKRLPNPLDHEQIQTLESGCESILDSFYMAFEEIYRGPRGEIKERQSVYLPVLRSAGFGTAPIVALDLGSGRGEWLELLKEEGWDAKGVDSNGAMLEKCHDLGLKAEKGDALEFLKNIPDATLGAVTAFHVVEHIPFNRVMLLIDESAARTAPGWSSHPGDSES